MIDVQGLVIGRVGLIANVAGCLAAAACAVQTRVVATPVAEPADAGVSRPIGTENAAPPSGWTGNTLEKLRQQMPQHDTASLGREDRIAIANHVRECWQKDWATPAGEKQHVLLSVTTDSGGAARKAAVVGSDTGRMIDPGFHAFADRAIAAILDPLCSAFPLPKPILGKPNVLLFRFSP